MSKPAMVTSGDYRYWKCIFEIKYEQLKTTIYVCVCVCVCVCMYVNIDAVSKPYGKCKAKSTIDTHIKKKKQSKHNTKDSYSTTREEGEKKKGRKDLWKQTSNN